MKRVSICLLIILFSASMLSFTGCRDSEDPLAVDNELYTRDQVPDLDDEYGGFNFADETVGFNDPELLAEFGDDDEFDDPFERDPLVMGRERDRDGNLRGRVFLMITWGNLHRDSTITDPTDWTGSLSVNPGAVLLKRTIRFEPNDEILPRTQRDLLEWTSKTRGGIDGILVRIVPVPSLTAADIDAEIDSANTEITFATDPFKVTFTLDQLPNLRRIVTLEDGNAVAFTAVHVAPFECPRGFLRGVWRHHHERPGGKFFGKYVSETGLNIGHVKGFYGVNKEGEKVFFGKWISRSGRFRGILRGRYDSGEERSAGWFAGRWIGRDLRVHGEVKGEWRRNDECHGGFFRGQWRVNCRLMP